MRCDLAETGGGGGSTGFLGSGLTVFTGCFFSKSGFLSGWEAGFFAWPLVTASVVVGLAVTAAATGCAGLEAVSVLAGLGAGASA